MDPYKVLGISSSASDAEVKEAYRKLAKKYHPDNYQETPLKDVANDKMKEINEAYDNIMKMRKNGGSGNYSYQTGSSSSYSQRSSWANANYGTNSSFRDVRQMIYLRRIADAEAVLNGVAEENRTAEWYYLKGVVAVNRGWFDEATNYVTRACQMDPTNAEYRRGLNDLNNRRNGVYGGYNPAGGAISPCTCCQGMLCADCCCECFGGDLIRCC